ncbi:hypothetical protein ACH4JS_13540 [Streptomyces sp. NPDC017638]|uniref:hypothetical protein n=1 Tax=Streptomyces sp. NPDC017638 TaxID=3365004 RepID=UPI0037922073
MSGRTRDTRAGRRTRSLLTVAVAGVGTVLLAAGPAMADGFEAHTTDNSPCYGVGGAIDFVDYGPGAPGGGDNDDYTVIHDLCDDGHGVEGYAWLDGTYLGKHYNGNGYAGDPEVWDPFGDIKGTHLVGIKVCLVDGASDTTPSYCGSAQQYVNG